MIWEAFSSNVVVRPYALDVFRAVTPSKSQDIALAFPI
jgi:hypothetical protein